MGVLAGSVPETARAYSARGSGVRGEHLISVADISPRQPQCPHPGSAFNLFAEGTWAVDKLISEASLCPLAPVYKWVCGPACWGPEGQPVGLVALAPGR